MYQVFHYEQYLNDVSKYLLIPIKNQHFSYTDPVNIFYLNTPNYCT